MPIYEYECSKCGQTLEIFQKITEEPAKRCPTCDTDTLNKLISSTSFQLKGTGWYVTDIRDKNKPKPKEETADTSTTEKTENKTTTTTTNKDTANAKIQSNEKPSE